MQVAHYLRLDCTSSEKHWLVHIETLRREALTPIATQGEEGGRSLASQLLWQDFGHHGDWQYPAASAAINSKAGWEVGILQTALADDVYMLVRKAPKGDECCLPANHFGACLIRDKSLPSVHCVFGRVVLVKVDGAQSDGRDGFCFQSYTAEQFVADMQHLGKEIVADVSFNFDGDGRVDRIPGSLRWCTSSQERHEATYVRLTCTRGAGSQLDVFVEPCRRAAPIEIVTPCSFKEMRQQLARGMFWHDFGHDSDWRHPYSKSHISTKFGWEVGLLETKLGDDICMLARKPPSNEQMCIPFNPFAMKIMHDRQRPYIQFVNGSVLLVRADRDLSSAQSERGTYTFRSLDVADFCDAFQKLGAGVRAGVELTTRIPSPPMLGRSPPEDIKIGPKPEDIKILPFQDRTEAGGYQLPMESTAAHGVGALLDGWEWVASAEVTDSASYEDDELPGHAMHTESL